MQSSRRLRLGVSCLAFIGLMAAAALLLSQSARAQQQQRLDLIVHPEFTAETATAVYQPLLRYLRAETGLNFRLVTPRDYRDYWRMLQSGETHHIAIDHPHIAAYRIRRFGYEPLVRADEPTRFMLITSAMADTPEQITDEVISTMPSPSLGYAILTRIYPNPLQQPTFTSEALSWRDAVEIVFAGEAAAAIVPDWLAERYPNLYPIYESAQLPGTTLTTSPEVDQDVRTRLADALLKMHENPDLREVQVELNVERFEPARRGEYAAIDEYLAHAFGYRREISDFPPIEPD